MVILTTEFNSRGQQRTAEVNREQQRSTEDGRAQQRTAEVNRERQRSTENGRGQQRTAEVNRERQSSKENGRVQRGVTEFKGKATPTGTAELKDNGRGWQSSKEH